MDLNTKLLLERMGNRRMRKGQLRVGICEPPAPHPSCPSNWPEDALPSHSPHLPKHRDGDEQGQDEEIELRVPTEASIRKRDRTDEELAKRESKRLRNVEAPA